ncbi:aminotransferase class I/II-fold pyridoxal phosphate-dependent enzyme, partial [Stenotrophomonas maltophilia]|uniref:aminotransferase class I/II-fold pyridoxal phosphate-dependent enzyme n=1 Tax=Stenotrophomonas maltophilia TaxID=40324 RepID=UPI0013D9AD34
ANLDHLRAAFRFYGLACFDSESAITALKIGDEERARQVSEALREAGVYAPAVTFPIVARGEARLRIQVSA